MCPSHLSIHIAWQLVGNDAEEDCLAIFLIDGWRQQSVAVPADAIHFEELRSCVVGNELAVRANSSHPAEGAHTRARVERSAGEEPFAIAHVGHVWHFPESAVLIDIGTLEEDAAVVRPRTVLVLMERASTHTVLARTHDDVLLSVGCKEIRVAEVVGKTSWTAIDDDTLLVPTS